MTWFHSARILIAEDSQLTRIQLRHILEELNVGEIHEATDGMEAWNALQEGNFTCLLLDWEMPRLDGLALLEKIRQDKRLQHLPVLMITIHSDRQKVIQAMQHNLRGYIHKPIDAMVVKHKVKEILSEPSQASAP